MQDKVLHSKRVHNNNLFWVGPEMDSLIYKY